MEPSDAGRTQLKERRRRRRRGRGRGRRRIRRVRGWDAGEVEPPALTQRGGAKRDEEERDDGWGGGGGGDFKPEAARNSRLGCCGGSVSRTDHFLHQRKSLCAKTVISPPTVHIFPARGKHSLQTVKCG